MTQPNIRKCNWASVLGEGRRYRLVSFNRDEKIYSYEEYYAEQRKYWNADDNDKTRFKMFFGVDDTEEAFKIRTKKDYESYVEYKKKWKGLFYLNDTVFLYSYLKNEPNVVLVTNDKSNRFLRDHQDLELHLYEEITFFLRKRIGLVCVGYTSGTVSVPVGSIEHQMGERPGEGKIYHKKIPQTPFVCTEERFSIQDAIFEKV